MPLYLTRAHTLSLSHAKPCQLMALTGDTEALRKAASGVSVPTHKQWPPPRVTSGATVSETHGQWCTARDMMHEVGAEPPHHRTRSAGVEAGDTHCSSLGGGRGVSGGIPGPLTERGSDSQPLTKSPLLRAAGRRLMIGRSAAPLTTHSTPLSGPRSACGCTSAQLRVGRGARASCWGADRRVLHGG